MRKEFTHAVLVLLLCVGWASTAQATTFTVSNTNSSGPGSYLQAITDCNADATANSANPHLIKFDECLSGTIVINNSYVAQNWVDIVGPVMKGITLSGRMNITNAAHPGLVGKRIHFYNLTFADGNTSSFGGGIMYNITSTTLNFTDCRFTNNTAGMHGGAFFQNQGSSSSTFYNCTFDNNHITGTGGVGGSCLFDNFGAMTVVNCTFSGNTSASTSTAGAGAIYSNSSVNVYNSTFYNNTTAGAGGAIYVGNGTCTGSNNIFVGNTAPNSGDLAGSFASVEGHNIISDTSGVTLTGTTTGNVYNVAASAVINTNLQDNGDYLLTHLPLAGGPAEDGGAFSGNALIINADARGYQRAVMDVGAIDLNGTDLCAGIMSIAVDPVTLSCAFTNHDLTATVSGGTGPYDIVWENAGTMTCATVLSNAAPDNYTIYVVDDAGCLNTSTYTLPASPIAEQTLSGDTSILCQLDSFFYTIDNTETGVDYYLRDDADSSLIAGPFAGYGGPITGFLTNLNTPATYHVYAETTTTEWVTTGRTALEYDGIDDFVAVNNVSELNNASEFTIEGWFRQDQLDQRRCMFYTANSLDINVRARTWDNGLLYAYVEDANNKYVAFDYSNHVVAGQWFHFAMVYDGTQSNTNRIKVFIDGVQVPVSTTGVIPTSTPDFGTNQFYLGKFSYEFDDDWNGAIDEFKIWSRALDATDINTSMSDCQDPSASNLVAYYDMEHTAGQSILADRVTGVYNGALNSFDTNAAWIDGRGCVESTCGIVMADKVTAMVETLIDLPLTANLDVCVGDSAQIIINNSQNGVYYQLQQHPSNTLASFSQAGNGGTITLASLPITSNQTFHVFSSTSPTMSGGDCEAYLTTIINVQAQSPDNVTQNVAVCFGDTVTVGSSIYTTSGTYVDTLTNQFGCDSIVTTNVTINGGASTTRFFTECDGFSVTVGGNTYTTTGIYNDILTDVNGCDSFVTTNLTIIPTVTSSQTLFLCPGSSVTVGTNTYTTSGTYVDTLNSAANCDSVVTTNLTIPAPITTSQTFVECQGFSITVGSNTYNTTGVYTDVLNAANGCDSTVTTNLTINSPTAFTQTLVECAGYSITVGNNTYTTTGVYVDTLVSAFGCDSVVTTDLTVQSPISSAQTLSGCAPYSVTVGTNTYTQTGTYTDVLTAANGCDSTVTTNLTVYATDSLTNTYVECAGFSVTVGTNTYSTTGIYTDVFSNVNGCDSTVITDLTINAPTTFTQTLSECAPYSITVGSNSYNATGVYTDTLVNATGCDSIVTTDLTILQASSFTDVHTACNSFTWIDGNTYTSDNNTATVTLTNAAGCDSVVTLDLIIQSVLTTVTPSGQVTLTADAISAQYQWVDCNDNYAAIAGETGQSFTASANGDYAVIVTANGCTDTSACYNITGIGIADLANTSQDVRVKAWPNPTDGWITIEHTNGNQPMTVTVLNIAGQEVHNSRVAVVGAYRVDLSAFENGVYLIRAADDEYTYHLRVVVQR